MSQITWKNINAPDGAAALLSVDKGMERISKAFDPLYDRIDKMRDLDEQNWENTKRNNDQALRAELEGIENLSDYHKAMDEGQYDLNALRDRLGAQFSEDAFNKGKTSALGRLQEEAYNSALGSAREAGEQGLSNYDGRVAMERTLGGLGMKGPATQKFGNRFSTDNAYRQEHYEEIKDKNALNFFNNYDGPLETQEDYEKAMKAYHSSGITGDDSIASQNFMRKVQGNKSDAQAEREAERFGWSRQNQAHTIAERTRIANEREAIKKGKLAYKQAVEQGEDIKKAARLLSHLPPEVETQMSNWAAARRSLTGPQMAEREGILENRKALVDERINQLGSFVSTEKTRLIGEAGFTEQEIDYAKDAARTGKDAYAPFLSEDSDIPREFIRDQEQILKTGVIPTGVNKGKKYGFTPVESSLAVLKTLKQMRGSDASPWYKPDGYTKDDFQRLLFENASSISQYRKGSQEVSKLEAKLLKRAKQLEQGQNNFDRALTQKYQEENLTQKQIPLEDYMKKSAVRVPDTLTGSWEENPDIVAYSKKYAPKGANSGEGTGTETAVVYDPKDPSTWEVSSTGEEIWDTFKKEGEQFYNKVSSPAKEYAKKVGKLHPLYGVANYSGPALVKDILSKEAAINTPEGKRSLTKEEALLYKQMVEGRK